MKVPAGWRSAWQGLAPREKMLAGAASALVAFALVWWIAIGPALSVLRTAESQHQALDAQLGRMRGLEQQAKALQAQPKQGQEESLRQLEAAVRQRLGTSARMTVSGERVTITLAGTPADSLATWLTQARVNARALPSEARLTRAAAGGWDGTIVVTLPGR